MTALPAQTYQTVLPAQTVQTVVPTQTVQTVQTVNPTFVQTGRVSNVGRVSTVGTVTGLPAIGSSIGVSNVGSSNLAFPPSYTYTTAPATANTAQTVTTTTVNATGPATVIGQPVTTYSRV